MNTQKQSHYPEFQKLIKEFEPKLHQQSLANESGFIYLSAPKDVFVSAPHSVEPTRDGKARFAETRTGTIAKFLSSIHGYPAFIKTKNLSDDPNHDPKSSYKDSLSKQISSTSAKALLDIHIMSSNRDYDVDIGTGDGKNISGYESIPNEFVEIFNNNGIINAKVNYFFKSNGVNTVSSFISRSNNIPTFQLEINYNIIKDCDSDKMIMLLKSLIEITDLLQESEKKVNI
jgi:hypothetical protein